MKIETVQSPTGGSAKTTTTLTPLETKTFTILIEYEKSFESKLRYMLFLKQKFDNTDRVLYPQFRVKLEVKLQIDNRAIGGLYKQIWFRFSCLDGSAISQMLPWMKVYKNTPLFISTEFFKQLDIAFGDFRKIDKAVGLLSRIR